MSWTPSGRFNLRSKLAPSEEELRSSLCAALTRTGASGEFIFFNSQYNPHGLNPVHLPRESEALYRLASECVALRERLNLDVIGTVGQLFLSACNEASNVANEHRRGPRQLSIWLLHELAHAT